MEGSNGWNSSHWIDELAKFAGGNEMAKQNLEQGTNTSLEDDSKERKNSWGVLVDVGEPAERKVRQERDNEGTERRPVVQTPPASNHQRGRTEETEKAKKKVYNTEQISCTLTDLILGLDSPTIRAAISKMDEEREQQQKSSPPSIVTFESIVEEQKMKAKPYNTNAKEFVPMFTKRG